MIDGEDSETVSISTFSADELVEENERENQEAHRAFFSDFNEKINLVNQSKINKFGNVSKLKSQGLTLGWDKEDCSSTHSVEETEDVYYRGGPFVKLCSEV